jgi:hypothetical protein
MDWGKRDRVPLLLVAGTKDRLVLAAVVKKEKSKYNGPGGSGVEGV